MKNFLLVIIFFSSFLFVDSIIVDLKKTPNKVEEMRFVYISYLEYLNNFKGNSKTVNKTIIDKMIDMHFFIQLHSFVKLEFTKPFHQIL